MYVHMYIQSGCMANSGGMDSNADAKLLCACMYTYVCVFRYTHIRMYVCMYMVLCRFQEPAEVASLNKTKTCKCECECFVFTAPGQTG